MRTGTVLLFLGAAWFSSCFASCSTTPLDPTDMEHLVSNAIEDLMQDQQLQAIRGADTSRLRLAAIELLDHRFTDGPATSTDVGLRDMFLRGLHEVLGSARLRDQLDFVHFHFVEPYLTMRRDQAWHTLASSPAARRQLIDGIRETGIEVDCFLRGTLRQHQDQNRWELRLDVMLAGSGIVLSHCSSLRR